MRLYDPFSLSASWFLAWRKHLLNARLHPEFKEGYGRAALIAQAYYVMYAALESQKEKSKEEFL